MRVWWVGRVVRERGLQALSIKKVNWSFTITQGERPHSCQQKLDAAADFGAMQDALLLVREVVNGVRYLIEALVPPSSCESAIRVAVSVCGDGVLLPRADGTAATSLLVGLVVGICVGGFSVHCCGNGSARMGVRAKGVGFARRGEQVAGTGAAEGVELGDIGATSRGAVGGFEIAVVGSRSAWESDS